MRLDRADRALMSALQENARQTNVELAAHVGLSPCLPAAGQLAGRQRRHLRLSRHDRC